MCGGTHSIGIAHRPRLGLSPRVRGNLGGEASAIIGDRSIPACAGEPYGLRLLVRLSAVYPRVCGGTVAAHTSPLSVEGLSPRVRGNRPAIAGHRERRRSIPACAGEPRTTTGCAGHTRVYPRVCGGTGHCGLDGGDCGGLSPRVRGNPADSTHALNAQGSIPACAGEPRRGFPLSTAARVYPRVCGGTGHLGRYPA